MTAKLATVAAPNIEVAPDVGKLTPNTSNATSDFLAICYRNMGALSKVQQALIEGNRNVMNQRLSLFQSMLEQTMKSAQDIMGEPDLKVNLEKQFDAFKGFVQNNIGNNNILAEINARSNAEAAQIIQNRAFEALDEVQAILQKMLDASPVASRDRGL
jgi:phasin family protein